MKTSEKKKAFLESIGIDINNLPDTLTKQCKDMKETITREENSFLSRDSLTGTYTKTFSLKDLVGTIHPDYSNKSWIETFLTSKRGDNVVDNYFRNPDYYSKDLKKEDQSDLTHDTPIELYECDGQFFIKGCNNRLSLIMVKYLTEISKAQTQEEKDKINQKYTFVADVNPIPKDKDVMYMINMIRENYADEVDIRRSAKDENDCEYTIKIGDKTINAENKKDLELILISSYRLNKVDSLDELKDNIARLLQDNIIYHDRKDKSRAIILDNIFRNLSQFQQSFAKLKQFGIEDKLYEGIDLNNINFKELSNRAIEIVEKEEKSRTENQKVQENSEPVQSIKVEKPYINEHGEIIRVDGNKQFEESILDVPIFQPPTSQNEIKQQAGYVKKFEKIIRPNKQEADNSTINDNTMSFKQRIARALQNNHLLMKVPFIKNFAKKQLNVLPPPVTMQRMVTTGTRKSFTNWLSNNGEYRNLPPIRRMSNPEKKRSNEKKMEEKRVGEDEKKQH